MASTGKPGLDDSRRGMGSPKLRGRGVYPLFSGGQDFVAYLASVGVIMDGLVEIIEEENG
jgi:hypothetical protein